MNIFDETETVSTMPGLFHMTPDPLELFMPIKTFMYESYLAYNQTKVSLQSQLMSQPKVAKSFKTP